MRAISCAIISLVSIYIAKNIKSDDIIWKEIKGFFFLFSLAFLELAIVLMTLGLQKGESKWTTTQNITKMKKQQKVYCL